MKRFYSCAAALLLLSPGLTFAAGSDINLTDLGAADSKFKLLSEDLASALSYKAVAPAEPLGLTGFDIGIELSATTMKNADDWAAATSDNKAIDTLPVPKLHLHKGLPLDIDVGLVYTAIPTTNIKLIGGELRYAIISGNVALPAVAVRGTMTRLSGIDDLSFDSKGLELAVSKGFAMITPYATIGQIWTTSDPSGVAAAAGLKKHDINQTKFGVGANINFGLMNLSLEGDQTGDSTTYSAKVGLRF